MKDIKLETDTIIPPDHVNFSSFRCGMKVEEAAIITETEGNDIRLTIVTHCKMTNPATSNDAVNIFPVCYLSVVTSHSSFSPANIKGKGLAGGRPSPP
jgi:hypothetical protein